MNMTTLAATLTLAATTAAGQNMPPMQNMPMPPTVTATNSTNAIPLESFLKRAAQSNPTLAQANAHDRRSAAQAQQAGLYPNPEVGYQGEQIRGGSYGGGEQGGYVQQTIVLGGKLALRRNLYTQQKQSSQIAVEEQTARIRNDVTQAFYNALTAQAMVDMRQRLLNLSQDALETVHQLANVGQADAPDILQAEVEAEQASVELVAAQGEFHQNFRLLATLAGKPELPLTPLAGSLETPPDLDAGQQVATILQTSPTVQRKQQQIAIAEAQLKAAKRESFPDLQLKAGEQYNFEHLGNATGRAAGPQTFASAGINLPLWNRNQGNIAAAQADLESARQEVTRTQLALRQTAEPLAQSYRTARYTAGRYRNELIPRAKRAYELYLDKYQAMALPYAQVLVSQRTLMQLQIAYLKALHEEWHSAIALQNQTLTGALDPPGSSASVETTR